MTIKCKCILKIILSCLIMMECIYFFNYEKVRIYREKKLEIYSISNENLLKVNTTNKAYEYEKLKERFDSDVIRFHPNLPEQLLYFKGKLHSSTPGLTSIRWTGTVYQESWKDSPKFLLYSANYDSRIKNKEDARILALYDGGKSLNLSEYCCLFWYEESSLNQTLKTSVHSSYLIDMDIRRSNHLSNDLLKPFLLSCQLPKLNAFGGKVPFAVSLVKSKSSLKPTNILKLSGSMLSSQRNSSDRGDIKVGVCGKALFYYNEDFSTRLVEWIEIMRVLGVSKIIIYKTSCHRNLERVLEFYERQGFVQLISFYYPPPYVHEPTFVRLWSKTKLKEYRGAQKIYINDCLFRFKDEFDYLGVFDSDEIPILKKHETLPQFFNYIREKYSEDKDRALIQLRWKVFYTNLAPGESAKDIRTDLYILRHNVRSRLHGKMAKVIETNAKTFYDTKRVAAAAVHNPLHFHFETGSGMKVKGIPRGIAYMGHFGDSSCSQNCLETFTFEEETRLLKYAEIINASVQRVKRLLHIEAQDS